VLSKLLNSLLQQLIYKMRLTGEVVIFAYHREEVIAERPLYAIL